jgi:hypothetical protein
MSKRNIGGLATARTALRPVAQAAATSYSLAGIVITRTNFQSALFKVVTGVKTGTPTSLIVKAKLQECDTSGGTYTDVAVGPANPAVAITDITDNNQERFLEIDLSGLKEFIKLQFEVTFVGGTSPTILLAAEAVLGGGPVLPVVHA